MEELTGIHDEMLATGDGSYTAVTAYELEKATYFQQVFGLRGPGDTPSISTQTTEEEMLSYLMDSAAQSVEDGVLLDASDAEQVKFAGKKYFTETRRINLLFDSGNRMYFYVRGYVRRSGDLMTCVLLISNGLSDEEAESRLAHMEDSYRKG